MDSTLGDFERRAFVIGESNGSLYVRALRITGDDAAVLLADNEWWRRDGVEGGLGGDAGWKSDGAGPGRLYSWGRKDSRLFTLGAGVYQIGDGPRLSLEHGAALLLELADAREPGQRSLLEAAALYVGDEAVASFSGGA